ncbi:ankyrin repeat-containing [Fusarium acutatum]|uniref:Ankyrin repeat-containing n=1 Tax=Fusarium acutatum TaxID=78861 RepID=A0A8H4JKA8_9HYPO|nr:ankyrin repeat-containing [Fusarium acutatum]
MGSLELATVGTLSEFDIVLSISQEAINRQFKKLYNTPIDQKEPLPPPPGLEELGIAPPVKSKYLINHDLEIHVMEGGELDNDSGIVGHIQSPTIDLHSSSKPNTARVSLTFERVEGAERPDSVFNYWFGKGKKAEIKSFIINGWTMTWEVKLGQANIKNMLEDLIKPAKSNNRPEVLHPNLIAELDKVSSKHFTVASIFCICESTRLADTFELRNEKGELVAEEHQVEFMLKVSRYFSALQKATKPGCSTPDHPFVLGYGLSQEPQHLNDIIGTVPINTPKYFIPRDYLVTNTPGEENSKYTAGTFNFCILTHREDDGEPKRDLARTDPKKNGNAGKLQKTFFEVTKTEEQDGIMGFCRDLIFDKFLCDVLAKPFHIGIEEIFKKAMEKGSSQVTRSSPASSSINTSPKPPTWSRTESLRLEGKIDRLILDDKQSVEGSSTINVSWESDLQTNQNIEQKDARRRARFVIESLVEEHYDVSVTIQEVFRKYPVVNGLFWWYGAGGKISIEKDLANSVLPEKGQDGKLKLTYKKRENGQYGAFFTTTKDVSKITELYNKIKENPIISAYREFLRSIGFPEAFQDVLFETCKTIETQWAESIGNALVTEFESKWENGIKALDNNILMPAGDVFTFSDLGADPKLADEKGYTALHFAVQAGHDPALAVTPLLQRGADPNITAADGWTPLLWAVHQMNKSGDHREAILQTLLDNSLTDVNHKSTISSGDITPLILDIQTRSERAVQLLTDHGADITLPVEKEVEILWHLLTDASAKEKMAGDISLAHIAALHGHSNSLRLLLGYGADANLAARYSHPECISLLLARGANINAKANDRSTPPHEASSIADEDCVRLLLDAGADILVRCERGRWQSPIDIMPEKLRLEQDENVQEGYLRILTLIIETLAERDPRVVEVSQDRQGGWSTEALKQFWQSGEEERPRGPTVAGLKERYQLRFITEAGQH